LYWYKSWARCKELRCFVYLRFVKNMAAANVKSTSLGPVIEDHFPETQRFRMEDGRIGIVRATAWRIPAGEAKLRERDIVTFPYYHPDRADNMLDPRESLGVARRELERLLEEPSAVSEELEGSLYDKEGRRLIPKYNGKEFTAANDTHPEIIDTVVEVATEPMKSGKFASTAPEVARAVADAIKEGLHIAKIRKGNYVIASTSESGNSDELRLTKHPYLAMWDEGDIKKLSWYKDIPEATKRIIEYAGITMLYLPYYATHVHTPTPYLPGSKLLDPRIARAKSLLRETQEEKTFNFALYNTRHLLSHDLDQKDVIPGIADVRAILRRAIHGTHDIDAPMNAYEYFENAIRQVMLGKIHSPSRFSAKAEHAVVRVKEFATIESIDAPATPDLRLALAKAYHDQLRDILAYEAMIATQGDETKVLAYLNNKYGHDLFLRISAIQGRNSSYKQDFAFNKARYAAKIGKEKYSDHIARIQQIMQRIGNDFPIYKTQALIVNHILSNITRKPRPDIYTLADYLNYKTGIKPGIITDYKHGDPVELVLVQAEALKVQVKALSKVRDNTDLLEFFGVISKN
jgi:hypothetical protein